MDLSRDDLRKVSPRLDFTCISLSIFIIGDQLDAIEKAIYGNVLRPDQDGQ